MRSTLRTVALFWTLVAFTLAVTTLLAQAPPDATIPRVPNPPLSSDLANLPGDLRAVQVPAPSNLGDFVKDPVMAVALGKALFWDMQVGSDGVQACASCHFRAGADPRSKNQVSPGLRRAPSADLAYSTGTGPNHQLTASDFPLTRLATPGVRGALDPGADSNDAVSSQGIHHPGDEIDPQGFCRRRGQHTQGGAAQYAVGDQRGLQPPPVLGRARRERLQRRQPPGPARSGREDLSRRRSREPGRGAGRARERQPRVAGRGSHRERPRDGRTRPHSPRRRPRAGQGQTQPGQEGREGPSAGQAARVADRQRAGLDEQVAAARPLLQQI